MPWISPTKRSDGLVLRRKDESREEAWIVVPSDDRPNLTHCPCCDKTLATVRAAKLIADEVYPERKVP